MPECWTCTVLYSSNSATVPFNESKIKNKLIDAKLVSFLKTGQWWWCLIAGAVLVVVVVVVVVTVSPCLGASSDF